LDISGFQALDSPRKLIRTQGTIQKIEVGWELEPRSSGPAWAALLEPVFKKMKEKERFYLP
jgi:hypothetical protein